MEKLKTAFIFLPIFLPFFALAFIFLNEYALNDAFSGKIEFIVMMMCLGVSLAMSGAMLLSVNKKRDKNFVSSAPYAGKLEGLSKRQAFFGNFTLLLLGILCIGAALWALFFT
ncbi:MAG: hypothetical protein ACK4VI_02450 [Alphaproteobacteria bacterium]